VEIGVILVTGQSPFDKAGKVPKTSRSGNGFEGGSTADLSVHWDVLGRSVLSRTIERLKGSGLKLISVVQESAKERENPKIEPWEKTLNDYVRNGVSQTLVISARKYTELDVTNLISFHRQTSSVVTNVAYEDGPLGITLIDSKCALSEGASIASRLPAFAACSSTYDYTGYVNHLSTVFEYRELIQRALARRCLIRPVGREVRPDVWIADKTRVHSSARLIGPVYVGTNCRVHAGALLAATSMERDSEIDCGTLVESSSILPHTYVGPGLHVSHAVLNGSRLLHLGRQVDIELGETGLLMHTANRSSHRFMENLEALVHSTFGRAPQQDAPTPPRTAAFLERAQ